MIDHYRALFQQHAWLADSLCWTVMQPLDEGIALDDLLWRRRPGVDDVMGVQPDIDDRLRGWWQGSGTD